MMNRNAVQEERSASPASTGHVARVLNALESLATKAHTVNSLAEELGVHPRTVRRMLEPLIELQYVGLTGKEEGQPQYRATLKIATLAERLIRDSDLLKVSAPFVAKLRNLTGEACHLSIGAREGVSHILQEAGQSLVSVKPRAGEYVPYHATAVGKALLAFDPRCMDYLPEHLVAYTRHTLTTMMQLQQNLAEIRRTGVSHDALENSMELRCMAAPVCDASGVVAAIGVSAPSSRFTEDLVPMVSRLVRGVASDLSKALGGDLESMISSE
ncbi:IclR family transcriptional regulator [Gulosibacter sp. 10]|uniref:IclR family transcriptional regulator n=1 Tax=Gulosibacter sp. 10 TaxID=1255570 RepID=UPI00097F3410|nr:IclR family transcriptional regulator [Gulosibacter sp. 10]SJM59719.1 Transcriptional regulator, IclR family [Gulosibacter sp. 10]